ncbi:single-stranded DNA-binding protein [Ralstonia chuxiongensis]|uniref:single-stranded DNA-binding protein n=1 Tax=Ralstonia chuxiongensis TaxID=2957504 RepID=UPI0028F53962|nr:single-stranded DNA-binding protein [Ralstonia chuxiongensis]CAJ0781514.1 Single-stranded DNA-binding protein [Ralstonia chuxiongensis]
MLNKAILIGRLGADPELHYLPSGDAVSNLRLATTDRVKDPESGEWRELTEWHNLALYKGLAAIANTYLAKGARVAVEGRLKTRSWEKAGYKFYRTEIVVEKLKMFDWNGPESDPAAGNSTDSAWEVA